MLPLSDYLFKIESWKNLPEKYHTAYTQPDGQNWTVPAYDRAFNLFPVRSYNGDMLMGIEKGIPGTTAELREILLEIKERYPEAVPMMVSGYWLLNDVSDILNAFGVPAYKFSGHFSQIAYDVDAGGYADVVPTEGFMEALAYMKGLASDGLLAIRDYSESTILKLFNDGGIFTRMGIPPYDDSVIATDIDTVYGGYLLNGDVKFPGVYPDSPWFTVVLGGSTKEPLKTLSAFIDTFYADEDGIRDATYGLGELSEHMTPDGKTMDTGILPMNIDNLLGEPKYTENWNNEQALADWLEIRRDYIDSLPDPVAYKQYDFYYDFMAGHTEEKEAMAKALDSFVMEYIDTGMTEDEFLSKYKSYVLDFDCESIINSYNKAMGFTEFHYDFSKLNQD